jgi:hypothetical protein
VSLFNFATFVRGATSLCTFPPSPGLLTTVTAASPSSDIRHCHPSVHALHLHPLPRATTPRPKAADVRRVHATSACAAKFAPSPSHHHTPTQGCQQPTHCARATLPHQATNGILAVHVPHCMSCPPCPDTSVCALQEVSALHLL